MRLIDAESLDWLQDWCDNQSGDADEHFVNGIEMVLDKIDSLPTHDFESNSKWIPAKKKKPEYRKSVLVCTEHGYITAAEYEPKNGEFYDMNINVVEAMWWQNMPKPPKK